MLPIPSTAKHAAIATIDQRLAPQQQKLDDLDAQLALITAQRSELSRQAATIRAATKDIKPGMAPDETIRRELNGYLQLVASNDLLNVSAAGLALKVAQTRLATAGVGHSRLGVSALLQSFAVAEVVAQCVSARVAHLTWHACSSAGAGLHTYM